MKAMTAGADDASSGARPRSVKEWRPPRLARRMPQNALRPNGVGLNCGEPVPGRTRSREESCGHQEDVAHERAAPAEETGAEACGPSSRQGHEGRPPVSPDQVSS